MTKTNTDNYIPTVAVVGLGYVGLTLGVALARVGIRVYGIEKRQDVVDKTANGQAHFSETGLDAALASVLLSGKFSAHSDMEFVPPVDYYIITVGTPLKSGTYEPRLDMIEHASRQVAGHMGDNCAVILRSTVRIGTTRGVVKPVLDSAGKPYHLSMCPERTLEGDALRELPVLPQVIGGLTEEAADLAAALFGRLTDTIIRVADPETSEMIKLVDNTSRDVQFAFANEVARACDAIGINCNDVIRFGKLGYSRTNVAMPGLVGGPCLEKDPHILMSSLAPYGTSLEITAASRLVNERQPQETVAAIVEKAGSRLMTDIIFVVAGVAFKGRPETDDLRGSMALRVIDQIALYPGVKEIRIFDPVVKESDLQAISAKLVVFDDMYDACQGAGVVIIANNHEYFEKIDFEKIKRLMAPEGFVYDYWSNIDRQPSSVLHDKYFTVGNISGKFK